MSSAARGGPPDGSVRCERPAAQLGSSALRELRSAAHARVALCRARGSGWCSLPGAPAAGRRSLLPPPLDPSTSAVSVLADSPEVMQLESRSVVFQTGLCQWCAFREPRYPFLA